MVATTINSFNTLKVAFEDDGIEPGYMATMQIQLTYDSLPPNTMLPQLHEFFSNSSLLSVTYKNLTTGDLFTVPTVTFANGNRPFSEFTTEIHQQIATASAHIDLVPSFIINGGGIIPEPSSLSLLAIVGMGLVGRRRRPSRVK